MRTGLKKVVMINYSMRNTLRLLFGLVFTLLTGSCSKDSETDPNQKAPGASATDLLANANFDELVIQIAYVEGYRPSDLALADLKDFILMRTYKEAVNFVFLPVPSPGEEALTLQEIVNLENENRTLYNNGRTLAVYIYFADAPSSKDKPDANIFTLGAVYRNTSMVLHESTIRSVVGAEGPAAVEAAILTHEFGHLFGLVDQGAPEISPHEDRYAANHCLEPGCLMQASLEAATGLQKAIAARAAKNLTAVPDMGPECIRDLQAIGGR